MDKTVVGQENIYFEMESKKATDAGIYDEVACESVASATKQTGTEKKRQATAEPVHSCKLDAVIAQRVLYVIAVAVAVSFLTSAATLILALTMMTSRNTAATDCGAAVQGKLYDWPYTQTIRGPQL